MKKCNGLKSKYLKTKFGRPFNLRYCAISSKKKLNLFSSKTNGKYTFDNEKEREKKIDESNIFVNCYASYLYILLYCCIWHPIYF